MIASPSHSFASRMQRLKASEIRELLKHVGRPGMISFAGGIPDPDLFDLEVFGAAYEAVLSDPSRGRPALQYSATEGYLPLREWITEHMAQGGVRCSADNILITNGSQQALDLIGKLLIDPGSRVLVAAPTYLGALQSFSAYEPEFVPTDFAHGEPGGEARLLYVVPDFANPSGETLGLSERERILTTAERTGAIIVEDAAYRSLRYEGEDVPSIAALDQGRTGSIEETRTLYCGTFSKTLSPALRIGWICGPAALIRKLTLIKQGADLHSATINQMVLHEVACRSFDAQVVNARTLYRGRRDALHEALRRHAPAGVHWSKPEGGLFIWLTLPASLDTARLLEVALKDNLVFVPGSAFFTDGTGANTLRLSFSLCTEETIDVGVGRLCGLVHQELEALREATAQSQPKR